MYEFTAIITILEFTQENLPICQPVVPVTNVLQRCESSCKLVDKTLFI